MLGRETALIPSGRSHWASFASVLAFLRNMDEAETLPLFDFGGVPSIDDDDVPLGSNSVSPLDLFRENSGAEEAEAEEGEEEASTEDEDSV